MSAERKRVWGLTVEKCIADFNQMKNRTGIWDTPPVAEICRIGVGAGPKWIYNFKHLWNQDTNNNKSIQTQGDLLKEKA